MQKISPKLLDAVRERRPAFLNLVGNTPLVSLSRVNPNPKVRILAKLESANPGGSVKDRIALSMLEYAEASGELRPNKTILEATSGNTGIGLSMVAAVKGYRCLLLMADNVSVERRKILSAYGADICLTSGDLGTDGAIELAYEMIAAEPDRYYLTDQYNNEANLLAHYHGTAEEIWHQTAGSLTHFVASMGTTGTVMGTGRRLRELNPNVNIIGVEPHLGHRIQGLKNLKESYNPDIYDRSVLSDKVNVDDDAAYDMARRLAKEEGILVGMSSGAAVAVACDIARSLTSGIMVVVLPDGGERYLSTPLFQVASNVDVDPAEPKLHLVNTYTRRDEVFKPAKSDIVSMYTCGPTVHAIPHLGLYRRIVVADLVRRTVELAGWPVKHVMSVTDVDDRTIKAADSSGTALNELTTTIRDEFLKDLNTLGVKPADEYPRASDYVEQMTRLTDKLVERGYAYEKHKSVYFDIGKFNEYGRLSGINLNKVQLGATVDLDSYAKDDPRDFTLLKRSSLGEIKKGLSYKTRWGNIRPGWHIECSVMAMELLGEVDIHVGGVDLIFPHHENEIAISKAATGKSTANYWIHSGLVMVEGKKMSRSAATAVSVRDLLDKGYDGRDIRLFLIGQHYRQPLHFSDESLDAIVGSLARLDECVRKIGRLTGGECHEETALMVVEFESSFRDALFDDLNISSALASLFNLVRRLNRRLNEGLVSEKDANIVMAALERADVVLGILPSGESADDAEIDLLVTRREEARKRHDWAEADNLRRSIEDRSVILEDTPSGPRWRNR